MVIWCLPHLSPFMRCDICNSNEMQNVRLKMNVKMKNEKIAKSCDIWPNYELNIHLCKKVIHTQWLRFGHRLNLLVKFAADWLKNCYYSYWFYSWTLIAVSMVLLSIQTQCAWSCQYNSHRTKPWSPLSQVF